jgi:hypothetical protein
MEAHGETIMTDREWATGAVPYMLRHGARLCRAGIHHPQSAKVAASPRPPQPGRAKAYFFGMVLSLCFITDLHQFTGGGENA